MQKQVGMPSYAAMLAAAIKALGDVLSPEFRSVLWKAIGLSVLLFIAVFACVQAIFWFLTLFPWPWVETIAAIGSGLALLVLFFFLMAPVTALFAGLYLDDVSARVEHKHYGRDTPGRPMPTIKAVIVGLQFGLLVLAINILALPLVFTGIGAVALVVINAYLLSREYFEMAAMRHLEKQEAKDLRQHNGFQIFIAGLLPAVMTLVPFVNLLVPIFSTSYFVHLFKRVQKSSA